MSRRTLGCGAGVLLLLFVLVTPFLLVGGAGGGAQAAGPGGVSWPGSAGSGALTVVGGGTDCTLAVGCQARPSELSYVPNRFYRDAYTDPAGECTSWAAALWPGHRGRGVTWSGDAWEWLANAATQGYAIAAVPTVGSIAVWGRYFVPGDDATQFGHVAVVLLVTASSYTVSEMNVVGRYRVDTRTVPLPGNQAGFIPVPADAAP